MSSRRKIQTVSRGSFKHVSIIFQGYPKPRGQESQSSFNFRLKRDAAHVDGLIAETPGGPRRLKEPHAYVLGIPINQAPENASPMVVWEGSHHLMSSAFKRFFSKKRIVLQGPKTI